MHLQSTTMKLYNFQDFHYYVRFNFPVTHSGIEPINWDYCKLKSLRVFFSSVSLKIPIQIFQPNYISQIPSDGRIPVSLTENLPTKRTTTDILVLFKPKERIAITSNVLRFELKTQI